MEGRGGGAMEGRGRDRVRDKGREGGERVGIWEAFSKVSVTELKRC